jgi:hypothetical protein
VQHVPDTPLAPGGGHAPGELIAGLRAANARLRELLAERDAHIAELRADAAAKDTRIAALEAQLEELGAQVAALAAKAGRNCLLTELPNVSAAQVGCATWQPTTGMSERPESPGCLGPVVSLIATESGHTRL